MPNKPSQGRIQQLRSQQTQEKILRSALQILQKKGYQKARLQDIAAGAGLTLGALQHQFGNRQVLMEHVIDEVMRPLAHLSEGWSTQAQQLPLPQRAQKFVQRAWDNVYGTPRYVAAWSLFFGAHQTSLFQRIEAHREKHDPIYNQHFIDTFPEIVQHHPQPSILAENIFATLRGLSIMQLFQGQPEQLNAQLELLTAQITEAGARPTSGMT
ncbi:MAG TPA: TetR/AcrR family transcriptional regulator [Paenalcaligenes sp.]|nr:TetR/AcrR family transcriptional regulator [Paenalcaligenes sp.]